LLRLEYANVEITPEFLYRTVVVRMTRTGLSHVSIAVTGERRLRGEIHVLAEDEPRGEAPQFPEYRHTVSGKGIRREHRLDAVAVSVFAATHAPDRGIVEHARMTRDRVGVHVRKLPTIRHSHLGVSEG